MRSGIVGLRPAMLLLVFSCAAMPLRVAMASDGPFGIDHTVNVDNSGIWRQHNQKVLMGATIVTVVGGSLLFGDQDKLGNTFWRSVDSLVVTTVAAEGLKRTFRRERPSPTSNPNEFFKGRGSDSFPSGSTARIAAAVTPFVAAYGREHPAVYALELLPLYTAIARVKVGRHWQSDVLAGWALGTGVGIWAARRDSPLILSWLPGGFAVGYVHRF